MDSRAAEWPAAGKLTLGRRCREGSFSPAERDRALAALRRDFLVLRLVELVPAVVELARALLARHPLRAGDALQLGSWLFLRGWSRATWPSSVSTAASTRRRRPKAWLFLVDRGGRRHRLSRTTEKPRSIRRQTAT
jgi:hypothetical protein